MRATLRRHSWTRGPIREIGRGRPPRAAHNPPQRQRAGRAPGVRDHGDPRQDRRLRQELDRQHRRTVKKGQVLAELSVPELDAELQQKRAAIEQAVAKHKQAGAAVRVAGANVAGARRSSPRSRPGQAEVEADLARWQAEFRRVEELFMRHGHRRAACSTRPGASSARRRPPARRSGPRSRRRRWP